MQQIFAWIQKFFSVLEIITTWLWTFPCNIPAYRRIFIIGNLPAIIILLLGLGLYFTFSLSFVQVRYFKRGISMLLKTENKKQGSPLSAFFLSCAARIGPGNIVGVTSAIIIGGPGSLFWLWVSGFCGMATGFVEATLAQLFKYKHNNSFIGGIPYYGRYLLGNRKRIGVVISGIYTMYALVVIPSQLFSVFSATGSIFDLFSSQPIARLSAPFISIGALLFLCCLFLIRHGVASVIKLTNKLVPFLFVIYTSIALFLILLHYDMIGRFFIQVVVGAFKPKAMFSGGLAVAIEQGIRRGLMSHEAGQGTITMPAATASVEHPVFVGFSQSIGVFVTSFLICTITGLLVVFFQIDNPKITGETITIFVQSIQYLSPKLVSLPFEILMLFCYGMFSFSVLISLLAFIDIASKQVSHRVLKYSIKVTTCFICIPLGIISVWMDLGIEKVWFIGDLANGIMVLINFPLLVLGFPYVKKALMQYKKQPHLAFYDTQIGASLPSWHKEEDTN